jgi:hypothetical protein
MDVSTTDPIMKKIRIHGLCAVLLLSIALFATAQPASSSSQYQPAHILKVKKHHGSAPAQTQDGAALAQYDVTIRLKKTGTEYDLLYTAQPGKYGFQYMGGMDTLVLVEEKTVTFNDILGRSVKVPIVAQRQGTPQKSTNRSGASAPPR